MSIRDALCRNDKWNSILSLSDVQPSTTQTYIIPVFVQELSSLSVCVCRGLYNLYQLLGAIRYLLRYIFTPARQATSREATLMVELQYICMTTQLEHETDIQQILKQTGLTIESSTGMKRGGLCMQFCTRSVFLCVRGVLETEEGRQRQGGGGGVTMETISASAPGFPLD